MRTTGFWLVFMLFSGVAAAQHSVMMEDLTANEIKAAVAGGKTTFIFYVGGTHSNEEGETPGEFSGGPGLDSIAIIKHNVIASYVARRVAETLGNALAYSAFPHAPMGGNIGGGTVALRDETLAAVVRDVVTTAATPPPNGSGFKYIILLGDHGGSGQDVLEEVAEELDREWSAKGTQIFFFPVYAEAKREMVQHLAQLDSPAMCRNTEKMNTCHIALDDIAEVMFLGKVHHGEETKWIRKDKIASSLVKLATPELGETLIEQKVKLAVDHIRSAVGSQ